MSIASENHNGKTNSTNISLWSLYQKRLDVLRVRVLGNYYSAIQQLQITKCDRRNSGTSKNKHASWFWCTWLNWNKKKKTNEERESERISEQAKKKRGRAHNSQCSALLLHVYHCRESFGKPNDEGDRGSERETQRELETDLSIN